MTLPDTEPTETRRAMRRSHLLAAILVPALALAVFANAFENAFQLDDFYRVPGNPGVEQLHPMWRHFVDPRTMSTLPRLVQYRPLLPLSLSIDHALAGGHSLVVYHATNLLVHVVTCLLLYRLVLVLLGVASRRGSEAGSAEATAGAAAGVATGSVGLAAADSAPAAAPGPWSASPLAPARHGGVALAVALLYAVHPVSGVPVNYICSRDLLLMQMFLVGALLVYASLRQRGGGLWRWPLACTLLALSILSKTNAVAFPGLVLAYELTLGDRRLLAWRTWGRLVPFTAVVLAFFGVSRLIGFSDIEQLGMHERTLDDMARYGRTQLMVHALYYLRNVVWAFHMRPIAEIAWVESWLDPRWLPGLLLVAGSLVLAWRARRAAAAASFAILAYWVAFAPTSSFVPFRYPVQDYRGYPSLPWLLLALCLALGAVLGRRARIAVFAVALAWTAGSSAWHNGIFRDDLSYWGQSVRYGGRPMAHVNYGLALMKRGELGEARRHLEEALSRHPENIIGLINLANLDLHEGHEAEALARLERALAIQPEWADTHYWHARALFKLARYDEAATAAVRAVEYDPLRPLYRELADKLVAAGTTDARQTDDAARLVHFLELALRLDPGEAGTERLVAALYDAAGAALERGDAEAALGHLDALHARRESFGRSRFLLGRALAAAGRESEAAAALRRALDDDPRYFPAHFELGLLLAARGEHAAAARAFEDTLALKPDHEQARQELERCRAALAAPPDDASPPAAPPAHR